MDNDLNVKNDEQSITLATLRTSLQS